MGKIKNYFKRKCQKFLGINNIREDIEFLRKTQQCIVMNTLDLSSEQKMANLVLNLPTHRPLVRLQDKENIQKFLSLVRPVVSKNLQLVRIGGVNDGGYVMLTPPHTR